jgi:hypothetical protein
MQANFGNMFKKEDEQLETVPTQESFSRVVLLVSERYGLTHLESIMEICGHYEREVESIKPLLTPRLKLILTEEATKQKLLKDNTFLLDRLG